MRVSNAIGQVLAAGGVEVFFGLVGSGNFTVTNELHAAGAAFYSARHEGGAIMMADGYARACGKVGVCSVHQGPGFTNTLTGLTEAAKSRTPLLVLSPGFDAECSRWIAEESPLVSVGVETVGIDAGAAGDFDPPFPLHYYLLGAGKYGLTQLANLASLPPTGALLVVAPLKLVGGTGSPVRALALVPYG